MIRQSQHKKTMADLFALARARVCAVLEAALQPGGPNGAGFVDAVVAAVKDGVPHSAAPGETRTEGVAEAAEVEKKEADRLDAEEKGTLDLAMRIFLDERLATAKASGASAESARA